MAGPGEPVPRPLRDVAYDFVARVRYRIFGKTKEACPLMPPELRSRFSARRMVKQYADTMYGPAMRELTESRQAMPGTPGVTSTELNG